MLHNLSYLRRQAKQLKRRFNDGKSEAVQRVRPHFSETLTIQHTQALHVIARELGYASWPRLKLAVELSTMDRDARADRLKFALYLGQHWVVKELLDADPALPDHNLGLACALLDWPRVERAIAKDPVAATAVIGVRSPILHLAFSKHYQAVPDRASDMIRIAEALVAAGADVNDSYPSEPGSPHELSALYGAVGHAGNIGLASWLLDHGANPDDNESLYHATELGHLDGVRLLLQHNAQIRGTNALARMLDFKNLEGVQLLIDHGADPNEAVLDHPSGEPIPTIPALHQAARRGCDARIADLLLQSGADPKTLWQGHSAYALARMYGNKSFAQALEVAGHQTELSREEAALIACAEGAVPTGRPLANLPGDSEASRILTRIILETDQFDHAKRLVAAGIDPNVKEEMGMPPLHLAGWAGLPEQVAWLLTLNPDLEHVNDYGGDIIGTIVHGSENRLDVGERDHSTCAKLVLDAGANPRARDIEEALDEELSAFLRDWAQAHPTRIIKSTS